MFTLLSRIRSLTTDKRGVTAVEYGLIAGLIAAGLAVSIPLLVTKMSTVFAAIVTAM